jgi:hypothetical protein
VFGIAHPKKHTSNASVLCSWQELSPQLLFVVHGVDESLPKAMQKR